MLKRAVQLEERAMRHEYTDKHQKKVFEDVLTERRRCFAISSRSVIKLLFANDPKRTSAIIAIVTFQVVC